MNSKEWVKKYSLMNSLVVNVQSTYSDSSDHLELEVPADRFCTVTVSSMTPISLFGEHESQLVDMLFVGTQKPELALEPRKNTVLSSHGRPPWYGEDGQVLSDAFVVAIAGGSASGKTHVARAIVRALGSIPTVIILSQDSFYKRHSPEETVLAHANLYDFDHPDSIDMEMFASCLAALKSCKQSNIPVYSFSEHQRLDETKYLYGAAVVITEGILALHDPKLRKLYDLKVFVQCDSDLMLARRIKRDTTERGRNVEGILDQYLRYVKPSYDHFVLPSASHADIIVPGSNNDVAVELLTTHIRRKLQERANRFRERLAIPVSIAHDQEINEDSLNLTVLPETRQVKGMLTILRSKDTSKEDFIFFVDRLSTLLVEFALQFLPYKEKIVTTPVDVTFKGTSIAGRASIRSLFFTSPMLTASFAERLRSIHPTGGALERGFRRVINDVPVGSLLVQSECQTGEPLLLHCMLPLCVRQRNLAQDAYVFLLDSQIGSGAQAFMAIRVLLDHGVPQDHIIFVTLLVARSGGVSVLRRAFPGIRIVCGAVDDMMRAGWLAGQRDIENPQSVGRIAWVMEPGMGQIGDRYYL
ncbi:uridine kinase [Fistulina hepatica ATCC 64428]|nr:uridine kinase [Fistulina hepatica ATCC 64428]